MTFKENNWLFSFVIAEDELMLEKSIYWKIYVFVFIYTSGEICWEFVFVIVFSEFFSCVKDNPKFRKFHFFPNWI